MTRTKHWHNAPEDHHFRAIRAHLLRQSCVCALCGKPIENAKDASIDHIIPRSKGGGDQLSNLQIAHRECNQNKGSLDVRCNSQRTPGKD